MSYHDFWMTIWCLTEPKLYVEEPFHVSENILVSKNFRDNRVRGVLQFSVKIDCHTVPQLSVEEPFIASGVF